MSTIIRTAVIGATLIGLAACVNPSAGTRYAVDRHEYDQDQCRASGHSHRGWCDENFYYNYDRAAGVDRSEATGVRSEPVKAKKKAKRSVK